MRRAWRHTWPSPWLSCCLLWPGCQPMPVSSDWGVCVWLYCICFDYKLSLASTPTLTLTLTLALTLSLSNNLLWYCCRNVSIKSIGCQRWHTGYQLHPTHQHERVRVKTSWWHILHSWVGAITLTLCPCPWPSDCSTTVAQHDTCTLRQSHLLLLAQHFLLRLAGGYRRGRLLRLQYTIHSRRTCLTKVCVLNKCVWCKDLPKQPVVTECRVYNWNMMVCQWEPAVQDTGIETNQTLYWTLL